MLALLSDLLFERLFQQAHYEGISPHRAFVCLQLRFSAGPNSRGVSYSSLSHRQWSPEPGPGCLVAAAPCLLVKVTLKAGVLESVLAKVLSLRQCLVCHLVVRL